MAESSSDELKISGMAITFTFIAGILLIATGIITAFYGGWELLFGGVERDTETFINLKARTWGVLHFGFGILLIVAGGNLFVGQFWARMVGIAAAVVMLLLAIAALPDSPIFSAGLIVLNATIIWALAFHGRDIREITV
jgi:hypothetical protein